MASAIALSLTGPFAQAAPSPSPTPGAAADPGFNLPADAAGTPGTTARRAVADPGFILPVQADAQATANGPHASTSSVLNAVDFHSSDFSGSDPGLDVVAAASGTVTWTDTGLRGNCVAIIDHGNGWKTLYGHLENGPAYGDKVSAGQKIGHMGYPSQTCGSGSTRHLHFGVYRDGSQVPISGINIGGYIPRSNGVAYDGTWYTADGVQIGDNHCSDYCGPMSRSATPTPPAEPQAPAVSLKGSQGYADFTGDGRKDMVAFQVTPDNSVRVVVWPNLGNGQFGDPQVPWNGSTAWGTADRLLPAGIADVNGDGREDILAYFQYDDAQVGLLAWTANPNGGVTYAGQLWFSGQGWGYTKNMRPTGLADTVGDGRLNLTVLYLYDNNTSHLLSWDLGTNLKSTYRGDVWKQAPGFGEAYRLYPAGTTDIDHDGRRDIVMWYQYDNAQIGLLYWTSRPGELMTCSRAWKSGEGWGYAERMRTMGSSDISGDGHDDLTVMYYFEGGTAQIFGWHTVGDGTAARPTVMWERPVPEWGYGDRIHPMGTVDLNDDRKPEFIAAYDSTPTSTGFLTWSPKASGGTDYLGWAWLSGPTFGGVGGLRFIG